MPEFLTILVQMLLAVKLLSQNPNQRNLLARVAGFGPKMLHAEDGERLDPPLLMRQQVKITVDPLSPNLKGTLQETGQEDG